MIATGGAMSLMERAPTMGLVDVDAHLDFEALRTRISSIEDRLERNVVTLLESQGVRIVEGTGRMAGPNRVVVETSDGRTEELHADAVLLATGSRPRIPEWAEPDGDRVLTTRDAYPPKELPSH